MPKGRFDHFSSRSIRCVRYFLLPFDRLRTPLSHLLAASRRETAHSKEEAGVEDSLRTKAPLPRQRLKAPTSKVGPARITARGRIPVKSHAVMDSDDEGPTGPTGTVRMLPRGVGGPSVRPGPTGTMRVRPTSAAGRVPKKVELGLVRDIGARPGTNAERRISRTPSSKGLEKVQMPVCPLQHHTGPR